MVSAGQDLYARVLRTCAIDSVTPSSYNWGVCPTSVQGGVVMARKDDDAWDLATSVGATATMVAAASRQPTTGLVTGSTLRNRRFGNATDHGNIL